MNLEAIGTILIAAAIIEAVWESAKMTWQQGKLNSDRLGALIVGIGVAIAAGLDVCTLAGIKWQIPYIGQVLTGILISRGSNFVHDFLAAAGNLHQSTK